MKHLVLVRHAKSSWDAPVSDFDRPLNDRGKRDAPEMAQRLLSRGFGIDLFVSSPARRARKTARYFAEAFDVKKEAIQLVEALYLAGVDSFRQTVAGLPDSAGAAALFSHNPGITEYANSLSNTRIDDMPTCSLFAVSADVAHWADFAAAEKQFLFFDYPKNPGF